MKTNSNYEAQLQQKQHDIKLADAELGLKLFYKLIQRKNQKSEDCYYEVLSTLDEYSNYDCQLHKHSVDDWGDIEISYHEIKVRNNHISFQDYDTSMIDLYKIKQLQKIAVLTNKAVFVDMFYEADKTVLIWQIDPEKQYESQEQTIKWDSASRASNQNVRINKTMAFLPNNEAVKIRY